MDGCSSKSITGTLNGLYAGHCGARYSELAQYHLQGVCGQKVSFGWTILPASELLLSKSMGQLP